MKLIKFIPNKRVSSFLLFFFVVGSIFAQDGLLIKANKLFASHAYSDAIPKYESVLKRDKNNEEALRRLADCYRLNNNTEKAENLYEIIAVSGKAKGQDIVYYTQALMSNGKYSKAKEVLTIASSLSKDNRIASYSKALEQLDNYYRDSAFVKIKKEASLNSEDNDFAPAKYKDGIVFSSNRKRNQWISQQHDWTNKGFNYLYFSKQNDDKSFEKPESFSKEISTKYNDGPVSFTADGKEMYFTRNNIEDGKVLKSSDKTIKLKIFTSKIKEDGTIEEEVPFKYNSNEYNCAHPTLSADGNMLIFSSDMPGSIGGMDLWACTKKNGEWGKPFNLSPTINSLGNEVFPYMHSDGKLYYSSNGLDGLGGLDIYSAVEFDGDWINNGNLNAPINSSADDLGFILDKSGKTGYFSSNRNNKNNDDDIYSFVNTKPRKQAYKIQLKDSLTKNLLASKLKIKDVQTGEEISLEQKNGEYTADLFPNKEYEFVGNSDKYKQKKELIKPLETATNIDMLLAKAPKAIEGFVYDKATKKPLANATVVVNGQEFKTDDKGYYKTGLLNTKAPYKIGATQKDYLSNLDYVTVPDIDNLVGTTDIYLDKMEVNKAIKIDNIYFDLSKYEIRADAAKELSKLVGILKDNPKIIIELSSHTDCRSSKASNLSLSDKRAKSSAAYIISQGIDKKRITGKGYGESQLVNGCACEGPVKPTCSEEEHQANRRTEFKIVGFLD